MQINKCTSHTIKNTDERVFRIAAHILLVVLSVICVGAFLLVLGSSFQTEREIQQYGYSILPRSFSLEAYIAAFKNPKTIVNSYIVTIVTTVIGTFIGVVISAGAGYVISRPNYRYQKILSFYIFFTMLFSGGLVPSYILITQWLHLKNTIWAQILPLTVNAWYILLMKGFFRGLPDAITEAARIDGASELRVFTTIVLPISKPVLATIALFYALGYWNDWYQSLLYIDNPSLYKLQYLRMAMCVLAVGPMLVVFPFFQKYFVRGITVGAIKG